VDRLDVRSNSKLAQRLSGCTEGGPVLSTLEKKEKKERKEKERGRIRREFITVGIALVD
jgi:hypothetical protein